MEIPQATLGHHWQDSTHILSNVFTAGVSLHAVRIEASGFHGAEPGENRWTIPFGSHGLLFWTNHLDPDLAMDCAGLRRTTGTS